ncbi:MAG: DMT family transporter [Clostridia bacterium]|nr:DMT family transporter [Clostridia bacterium]
MKRTGEKKQIVYAVLTVFLWATMAPAVKLMQDSVPTTEVLFLAGLFSVVFLLGRLIANGKVKEYRTFGAQNYKVVLGLGFLGFFVYEFLYYFGIAQLTASTACILNYLWPVMLVLFSCLILKEPFTTRKVLAMVASFLGVVVLSAGGNDQYGAHPVLGIVGCIVAAVSYGLFSVLNKREDLDQDLCMPIYWGVTMVSGLIAGFVEGGWTMPDLKTWLILAWLGVMANAVGYLIWAIALNDSKNSARIANFAFLVPVLSMLLSALILREQIHWNGIAALVLILGGILYQSYEKKTE